MNTTHNNLSKCSPACNCMNCRKETSAQMKDTTKPACDCLICKPVSGTISSEESLVHKNMAYYHFSNSELNTLLDAIDSGKNAADNSDSWNKFRELETTISSILAARNSRGG